MMAAGGSLEPFWEMYIFHKKDEVYNMLKKYKIGQLHSDDILKPEDIPDFSDLHKQDLQRSPNLVIIQ